MSYYGHGGRSELRSADGAIHTRPLEGVKPTHKARNRKETDNEIQCCLNCDKEKCFGNCRKVKEAKYETKEKINQGL